MIDKNKQAALKRHEQLIDEYTKVRLEQEMFQAQLARKAKVGQNLISKIETRKNAPSVKTFLRLLLPLGKTLTITPFSDEKEK